MDNVSVSGDTDSGGDTPLKLLPELNVRGQWGGGWGKKPLCGRRGKDLSKFQIP